ncbi:unnamed protein product [Absidia cylindrospora]
MSHVDKLGILGIRSFSPEEPQYIKFLSPFTLIVGANGTGKLLLSNLAGVKEVKAQVRLKFVDVDGQRILCSRSLSLTQNKVKATLKTLDSSLQRYNPTTGETYSISSRCADMDALLPVHLGVPKAILENVIFCHQEESNWPLSEPAALKKKFDDIFASTKYTKALDSIKDIRKERAQDTRMDQVKLEGLKADTAKAKRLQSDVEDMTKRCQEKQTKIEELDEHIHSTTAEMEQLLEVHQQAQELANKISQVTQQKQLYQTNLAELEKDLTERDETNEELEALLQAQTTKNAADKSARQTLETERNTIEQRLHTTRNKVSSKLTEIGRLQAASDDNAQCIEEQGQLIIDICRELNLDQALQNDPSESILAIQQAVAKREKETQTIKTQAQNEQNKLSNELQALKSERAGLDEAKKHTQRELEKDKATINALTTQLDSIRVTHVDINMEKDRLDSEESRLATHQSEMNSNNMDTQLLQKERQLRDLDDQVSNLNDEMSKLSMQGDTRARLALKQGDRDTKLAAARSIFEQCKDDVAQKLEIEPTLEHLDKDIRTLLEKQVLEISAIQHRHDQANRDLSSVETLLSMTQSSVNDKRDEANALERSIQAVLPDASLPDELKKVDDSIVDLRGHISSLGAAELLYSRFVKKAGDNQNCPLCVRQFADNDELTAYIGKLEDIISKIPRQVSDYKQKVKEMEEWQQRLRSLESSWMKMESLRTKEIADLEKTVKEHERNQAKAIETMGKISAEMSHAHDDKNRLERIYKLSEDAVRQHREAKQLGKEIDRLEAELRHTGSTRTITDCKRELEDLADQGKTVRKEIKRLHDDREVSLRILQQLESNTRDARDKLTRLQHQMESRTQVESSLSTAQKSLNANQKSMNDYNSAIAPVDSKIDLATTELQECQQKWNARYDRANLNANKGRQRMDRLDTLNKKIERYEKSDRSAQLTTLSDEMKQLESNIKTITKDRDSKNEEIRRMDKELADRQGVERELKDHIRYRSIKENLKTSESELAEYKRQSQQFKRATYEQKLELLKNKQSQYIGTRGSLQGEIRQMRDQLERYRHDLSTDYQDIQGKYNKQYIQVKTNEMTMVDLEKYTKALQQAIMRYHTLKMEDLNKIIKELWMSTYRGGDIDYIEIRSDAEGTTAANRIYNYRVVMVKNGKEMSIRGRCSAGQKVLTSIIIRLALAETFCINCGVLTLDEPTTNLDRANIESLADNLAKIIQSRRAQSNFQLVVITHDEEFVEYLSRAEVSDKYYRISKDENQCSIIRQETFVSQ